uniref:Uncharacterized protein n=1 Tax=Chromera velia CCMP2878 TaxID=1169474 RepID=A0A0G4IBY9_9ALVE|eukprot:Cvel_2241.t1-p1 / transcript=Cvel_2241.t1 / gene=Cvel_2241 / organism=Chromera_velia_CCMP2878 / gene_product=hypothetical protein / transcript_product=hypothetical protein / location=Cvel_scaffold86:84482-90435(-) / protein_length=1646 / sequence_SO=supercontig / SO=protein_coding / is_pseudo=false
MPPAASKDTGARRRSFSADSVSTEVSCKRAERLRITCRCPELKVDSVDLWGSTASPNYVEELLGKRLVVKLAEKEGEALNIKSIDLRESHVTDKSMRYLFRAVHKNLGKAGVPALKSIKVNLPKNISLKTLKELHTLVTYVVIRQSCLEAIDRLSLSITCKVHSSDNPRTQQQVNEMISEIQAQAKRPFLFRHASESPSSQTGLLFPEEAKSGTANTNYKIRQRLQRMKIDVPRNMYPRLLFYEIEGGGLRTKQQLQGTGVHDEGIKELCKQLKDICRRYLSRQKRERKEKEEETEKARFDPEAGLICVVATEEPDVCVVRSRGASPPSFRAALWVFTPSALFQEKQKGVFLYEVKGQDPTEALRLCLQKAIQSDGASASDINMDGWLGRNYDAEGKEIEYRAEQLEIPALEEGEEAVGPLGGGGGGGGGGDAHACFFCLSPLLAAVVLCLLGWGARSLPSGNCLVFIMHTVRDLPGIRSVWVPWIPLKDPSGVGRGREGGVHPLGMAKACAEDLESLCECARRAGVSACLLGSLPPPPSKGGAAADINIRCVLNDEQNQLRIRRTVTETGFAPAPVLKQAVRAVFDVVEHEIEMSGYRFELPPIHSSRRQPPPPSPPKEIIDLDADVPSAPWPLKDAEKKKGVGFDLRDGEGDASKEQKDPEGQGGKIPVGFDLREDVCAPNDPPKRADKKTKQTVVDLTEHASPPAADLPPKHEDKGGKHPVAFDLRDGGDAAAYPPKGGEKKGEREKHTVVDLCEAAAVYPPKGGEKKGEREKHTVVDLCEGEAAPADRHRDGEKRRGKHPVVFDLREGVDAPAAEGTRGDGRERKEKERRDVPKGTERMRVQEEKAPGERRKTKEEEKIPPIEKRKEEKEKVKEQKEGFDLRRKKTEALEEEREGRERRKTSKMQGASLDIPDMEEAKLIEARKEKEERREKEKRAEREKEKQQPTRPDRDPHAPEKKKNVHASVPPVLRHREKSPGDPRSRSRAPLDEAIREQRDRRDRDREVPPRVRHAIESRRVHAEGDLEIVREKDMERERARREKERERKLGEQAKVEEEREADKKRIQKKKKEERPAPPPIQVLPYSAGFDFRKDEEKDIRHSREKKREERNPYSEAEQEERERLKCRERERDRAAPRVARRWVPPDYRVEDEVTDPASDSYRSPALTAALPPASPLSGLFDGPDHPPLDLMIAERLSEEKEREQREFEKKQKQKEREKFPVVLETKEKEAKNIPAGEEDDDVAIILDESQTRASTPKGSEDASPPPPPVKSSFVFDLRVTENEKERGRGRGRENGHCSSGDAKALMRSQSCLPMSRGEGEREIASRRELGEACVRPSDMKQISPGDPERKEREAIQARQRERWEAQRWDAEAERLNRQARLNAQRAESPARRAERYEDVRPCRQDNRDRDRDAYDFENARPRRQGDRERDGYGYADVRPRRQDNRDRDRERDVYDFENARPRRQGDRERDGYGYADARPRRQDNRDRDRDRDAYDFENARPRRQECVEKYGPNDERPERSPQRQRRSSSMMPTSRLPPPEKVRDVPLPLPARIGRWPVSCEEDDPPPLKPPYRNFPQQSRYGQQKVVVVDATPKVSQGSTNSGSGPSGEGPGGSGAGSGERSDSYPSPEGFQRQMWDRKGEGVRC